ncbi:MAG: AMP-binding protein, partial [Vampirovibrio sp.]|nr:AMP-binding protein [Vampirovibrio sp.]
MASTVTNLAQLLLNAAKLYPTASAIVTGSEQITYEEVAEQIRRLAAGYQHLNLKPGDRVGILLYNTPGFIISYFALLGLGITVLTLSTRLKASELDTVLSDAQVSWLITDTSFLPVTQDLQVTSLQGILFESNELSVLANALPSHTLNVLMEHPPVPAEDFPIPVTDKTLATLIYTSGTTGKPKGVMLSHQNLWADANANCQVIEASEQDVFITISPLFHVFGQTNVLLTAVMSGAKLVLIPKFSPKAVLSAIETHQVTFMAAVPTMYQMMLSQLKDRPYNLSSLRVCHSGAAPMPKTVFQQIEQIFDAPVQEGYGLSEASSIITSNPLHGVRKPGSIGYGLPGITVKVMDDTMQETEPGEIGEIHARGPTVMLGYWQNPDATEKRLINGWLKTGDLAWRDEDG